MSEGDIGDTPDTPDTIKTRGSTFNYWVEEESGPVTPVSIDDFMVDNPGYMSEYTKIYNLVRSSGCTCIKGVWVDPDKKRYKDIQDVYNMYALKQFS